MTQQEHDRTIAAARRLLALARGVEGEDAQWLDRVAGTGVDLAWALDAGLVDPNERTLGALETVERNVLDLVSVPASGEECAA